MDHSYFKDRVSAYHDAGLNLEEQELLRQHIAECEECRAALAELEAFDRMVDERSRLQADEYFEQNAQKIEAALGFGGAEKVTDITPPKRSGLWWKASAVVATAAVLAFIAIHQEEIVEPVRQPQPQQESQQLKNEAVRLPETSEPTPDVQADEETDVSRREGLSRDADALVDDRVAAEKRSLESPPPAPSVVAPKVPARSDLQSHEPNDISQSIRVEEEAFKEVQPSQFNSAGTDVASSALRVGGEIGESTVLGGGRKPDSARLAFWQGRLAELTGSVTQKAKGVAPSALADKLSGDARKRSLVAAGERADSAGTAASTESREVLDAYYMVASLTADTAEYYRAVGYVRTVADSSSTDLGDYAKRLLDLLQTGKK